MTNRIRLVAVAAVVITATLLAAPSAHAEDQRPCVSRREFNGMHDGSLSRVEVEARWDVTGRGIEYWDGWFGDFVIYPKCGAEKALTSGLYWYGVKYKNRETAWQYLIWDH